MKNKPFSKNQSGITFLTAILLSILSIFAASTALAADSGPAKNSANKTDQVTSGKQTQAQIRDAGVTVKTNTREVTVVGEVVDTWCYCSGVMGDGRGEEHKKCARLCVGGGVTAGILADDGTLYIAAKHKGYNGCAGLLLPYVATKVKAKGWLAERGGIKVLKISSVEPVKVPAKTNTRHP